MLRRTRLNVFSPIGLLTLEACDEGVYSPRGPSSVSLWQPWPAGWAGLLRQLWILWPGGWGGARGAKKDLPWGPEGPEMPTPTPYLLCQAPPPHGDRCSPSQPRQQTWE